MKHLKLPSAKIFMITKFVNSLCKDISNGGSLLYQDFRDRIKDSWLPCL